MNEIVRSSSSITCAGSSPATIWQKMQSGSLTARSLPVRLHRQQLAPARQRLVPVRDLAHERGLLELGQRLLAPASLREDPGEIEERVRLVVLEVRPLADLDSLEKRTDNLEKKAKGTGEDAKEAKEALSLIKRALALLKDGKPARFVERKPEEERIFRTLGLNDYRVRLGFRDPASSKYVGSQEDWDTAQTALESIVKSLGMSYTAEPGEAPAHPASRRRGRARHGA